MFDTFETVITVMGLSIRVILLIEAIFMLSGPLMAGSGEQDIEKAKTYLKRGRVLYERSAYDSLPYYFLTAKVIFQHHGMHIQASECFLGMSDYYRISNRFDLSEITLDSADYYIRQHIGLRSLSWADALSTRAKLLSVSSQNKQAIELLNQSVKLLEQLEAAPQKISRVHNILGATYFIMGDLQKSQEYYMKAYNTFQQLAEGPSAEKGRLLYNIGLVYSRLGNQLKWLEYTYKGIDNSFKLSGPEHPELAKFYRSLSGYFIENGMSDSAMYYLEKSEEIEKKAFGEDHPGLVPLYIQRARIFRLEGNYYRALEYYQHAFGILQKNGDTTGYVARVLYINMGSLYKALGDYASARKELIHLLDAEGRVHPSTMATYFYYLADIQRLLGNYDQSGKYFREVFAIRDQYLAPDFYSRAYDHLGYGILLDSLKMYEQANTYFLKAVKVIQSNYGMHNLKTAMVLKSTGDHYYLTGEHDKALDYYQQCIFSMVPDYDVTRLGSNPPPEQISDNLFYLSVMKNKAGVMSDLAERVQDPEEKLQTMRGVFNAYQTSINIIDLLRNTYLSDRSKLFLSANERDTYEKCVESAYRCYEISQDADYLNQAFMVAEKGKYATLLSILQREETIILAGIPDSIVKIDASLRKELAVHQELLLESQADTLYDSLAIQQYQAQIFKIRNRIENLNQRLERDFPGYFNLLYNQRVIDPGSVRKKLRSSEKLLEYFYTEKNLYLFEVSRKGLNCHKIPTGEDFDKELTIVENYLDLNFLLDTVSISHELFLETAFKLHERLIPPSHGHSRLIIIPEGKLAYFPFDILVTEPVPRFSGLFSDVPFLIKETTLSYGYSATLMDRLERNKRVRLNKLIAFAPGYERASNLVASAGYFREIAIDRTSLKSLPGSINEVVEIGKMSGGMAFTGTTASEELFKRLAGESHIIHLATHAFLDDNDPLKSKLVFSEGTLEEDGFLNVYEIYNLDLKARLVVLSACNTGTGISKGGEGIMSLARAFIYAGVPNIIMTLWTVSDKQSYKLMLEFYRQLISGRSTEMALRNAKLTFLQEADPTYQHPQYWAGYILVGNPDNILLPRLIKWLLPVLLIIMILMTGSILFRRKIRRKV